MELPLDWVEEFHEPLLSFKPAIHFIAPWFGLAPKPSHYFSRFGLGSEDFRCLICWIQKFQRALVGSSPTVRVIAVLFDGVSDVRLDFFYLACCGESRSASDYCRSLSLSFFLFAWELCLALSHLAYQFVILSLRRADVGSFSRKNLVSLVREFAPLCDVIPGTNSSG